MTGDTPEARRARGYVVLRCVMAALGLRVGRVDRERLIVLAGQYGVRAGVTREEVEEVIGLSIASMFCEASSVDDPDAPMYPDATPEQRASERRESWADRRARTRRGA